MTITINQLAERVRKLAAEQPDHEAECRYVTTGSDKPMCIMGCALHAEGVSLDTLAAYEGKDIYVILRDLPDIEHPTDFQAAWFSTVQSLQDGSSTWAEAVALADHEFKGVAQ